MFTRRPRLIYTDLHPYKPPCSHLHAYTLLLGKTKTLSMSCCFPLLHKKNFNIYFVAQRYCIYSALNSLLSAKAQNNLTSVIVVSSAARSQLLLPPNPHSPSEFRRSTITFVVERLHRIQIICDFHHWQVDLHCSDELNFLSSPSFPPLASLCNRLFLSAFDCHITFHSLVGVSVATYHTQWRMFELSMKESLSRVLRSFFLSY